MIPQVGQRWLYDTNGISYPSKVIFEVENIAGDLATCIYVQVISKGYEVDRIGYRERLSLQIIEHYSNSFTYLEGQDRPQ